MGDRWRNEARKGTMFTSNTPITDLVNRDYMDEEVVRVTKPVKATEAQARANFQLKNKPRSRAETILDKELYHRSNMTKRSTPRSGLKK